MSFFKHSTTKTSVSALEVCMPIVIINTNALTKMQLLIDKCSDEVGWLGTATRERNIITIHDVFLFDQEVHATTTEITPEGLAKFGEEILNHENGMEIWNNLKLWGHSHVRMSATPSGQDNTQMNTFAEGGHDWFVRIIGNKNGDIKIDVWDYANGIIFSDVQWGEALTAEEQAIEKRIAELEKLLEVASKQKVTAFEDTMTKEIAEKVKKKTYGYTTGTYWAGKNVSDYRTDASSFTATSDDKKKLEEKEKDKNTQEKKNTKEGTDKGTVIYDYESMYNDFEEDSNYSSLYLNNGFPYIPKETTMYNYASVDLVDNDLSIWTYFTKTDLLELADCRTSQEFFNEIITLGYEDVFSYNDILAIKDLAKREETKELFT